MVASHLVNAGSPSTLLMETLGKEDKDLHGNVTDKAGAVLILVDVISDLDFPDNGYLVRQAE